MMVVKTLFSGSMFAVFHRLHQLGGVDMLRKLYDQQNVYLVEEYMLTMGTLWTKFPMTKIADLQGHKMRSPGGQLSEVLQALGAAQVVIPAEDLFSSLEKGVVDAADYGSAYTSYAAGIHKVAKYFSWPGFHKMVNNDIIASKASWNKLPDNIKLIVETSVRWASSERVQRFTNLDIIGAQKMIEAGNIPFQLSPDELKKARAIAKGVWDKLKEKSPAAKEAVESQVAFMKQLGILD